MLNMLLKLYLGTTAASWITTGIYTFAAAERIKRKGYKFNTTKKSFAENLASIMSFVFIASIPVYNIINTFFVLCLGDKMLDEIEAKLLRKGEIYMPNTEIKERSESTESNEFVNNQAIPSF